MMVVTVLAAISQDRGRGQGQQKRACAKKLCEFHIVFLSILLAPQRPQPHFGSFTVL